MTITINAPLLFGIIISVYWFLILPRLERKLEIGVIPYVIVGVLAWVMYGSYMLYRVFIWLPSCPLTINFT